MHEDPKQHHCSIYFRILLVACSHHPVHATFSADLVLLNLFPRDNYLWHPWANLLGILLPTSDNATLSAMCGSQLVQWPASRLPPHCRSRPRAQLLVQEWHRYRRDQQHVWLLMCATETVCLLSVLSVPDFPNTLLGQFSEKKNLFLLSCLSFFPFSYSASYYTFVPVCIWPRLLRLNRREMPAEFWWGTWRKGTTWNRWEDNIKMGLSEIDWEDGDWGLNKYREHRHEMWCS